MELSHVGTDLSSDPTSYDVINSLDGIDVYVDGHSHTNHKNGERVNDTLLVSTGEYLQNLCNLITDAMINETGADRAITNGGGIRATIKEGRIITGQMSGETIKVEVEAEYVRNILEVAIKSEYKLEVEKLEGKSLVKIYAPKSKESTPVAILEVLDMKVSDLDDMIKELEKEYKEDEDNNGNNGNGNKPSSPKTGDSSLLGYVGMGIIAVVGIYTNSIIRKRK